MHSPRIATLLLCLAFAFSFSQGVAFAQGPLTNGANHSGSIALAGEIDVWSFNAAANDNISVSIGEVLVGAVDPGFNPWIVLKGPNGVALAGEQGALVADIDVTAPLSGTYTVEVASYTHATGVGEYLLTLARTPGTFIVSPGDEGGPLINGANHPGRIHRGDLDLWSFTAAKDDAIAVSIGEVLVGAVDPGFNPWIRLRGPDGTTLSSVQGALSALITVTAPLTGTYTVVVSSYTVPAGTGEYLLTLAQSPGTFVVPPDDEGGPMTNGANHAGRIHRGDLDQWSFTANKDDNISLNLGEVRVGEVDPGFNPWIRLRGPDGADLGSVQGALIAAIDVKAPLTGTYTVVIASYTVATGIGEYLLTLAHTPGAFVVPPGDEGGALINGANHAGKIHPGDLDQWSFTAAKDDAISVSIGEILVGEVDPGFNPWIRLRGPDGTTLGSTQGALTAQISVAAPLSGIYTVVVSSYTDAAAVGEYLLTLAHSPGTFVVPAGDEGGALTNGANHAGKIHRGDLDQWSFTAAKDDAISLSIGEVLVGEVDPGFNPWIRLRGPDGTDLGSFQGALVTSIDITAPVSGIYTVVVASYTVPTATGEYQLTLAQTPGSFIVPAGDEGGPLSSGVNHAGVIHRGDLDQWTFTAVQGTPIAANITEVLTGEVDPGFNPWIRLRGPDGTLLRSVQGALTAQINVAAPLTGTYTIVVANFVVGSADGHYLLQVSGPVAVAGPTTVNDTYATNFDTPLDITAPGVLSNDNSNGGGPITATLITPATNGTVTLNANGSFTYTPGASFVGAATFTYRAVNAAGTGNVATVTVTVNAPSVPTAVNDAFTTPADVPLVVAAPGVLINDNSNGGGPMSVVLVASVSHGVLTLNGDGGFVYLPGSGFSGSDSFTYRAANAGGPGSIATASITVNAIATVQPPVRLAVSSIVGNVVTLRWNAPQGGLVPTDYVLEGGVVPGQVLASFRTGSTSPTYTFIAPTGAFYVRIHALSGASRSEASNEVHIFVNLLAPPSAPANPLGLVNGSSLTLVWRNTFDGGAPSSVMLDVTGAIVGSLPLGLTDTATFPLVPPGTYTFRLRSINAAGASAASAPVTLTVPQSCSGVPLPPANFLVSKTGNSVYVSWDLAPSGAAPTSYIVNVTGPLNVSIPTTVRSLGGVVPPGTYNLSVAAANACGASAATPIQFVTVP